MPKVAKPCLGCGVEFESWPNHGRKYCGRACSDKHGAAGRKVGDTANHAVTLACMRCGSTYERWPSQIAKNNYKFCSRECCDLHRQDRRTYDCAACGKTRTVKAGMPNRYCSTACWYSHEKMTPEQRKEASRRNNYRRRERLEGLISESYTAVEIGDRDKWRCGICQRKVNRLLKFPHVRSATIDHIVPISHGGHDVKANVQIAHYGCNSRKRDRTLPQGEQLRLIG